MQKNRFFFTLRYFDLEKQDYHENKIDEQVEVISLVGNVALKDGKPKIHAHVVEAKCNGAQQAFN